ncbi:LEAF RUST 10 DISEASE-RESISTANCE LOCUS RECEPTOR-LIKE PROTEIN KINASE-like 1.2 [Vicia villosa]|uniref:LEAF RUST 10 DISEASE-RESISTANCE LOCUS RECEPTOR-LIKE PROTEIN KINASE-like 1.2 n=1 Tax=Vicia villosa TaxID=3911 RepID=UPI00273AC370|nr:LEAF RUST 10 DISEASE-RESISTANCE LOCUS RECEPTOR-LIKE PROTEIN KINASE-like 1.2 [Vicia villosa]
MYTILYEYGDLPNSYFTPSFQIPFEVIGCYIDGKFHSRYVVSSSKLTDFNAVNCKHSITVPRKKKSLPNKSRVMEGILVQGFEVRWNIGTVLGKTGTWNLKKKIIIGKLPDGREVAVKRLFKYGVNNEQQFLNEINILARTFHRNLILLYGCTSLKSRRALVVYEYVPNGPLSDHLHGDKATPNKLPWNIRMRIAVETTDALNHLHASHIIHRDIKTSNILLDAEYHVKVDDFGLSRLFPKDQSHGLTIPQRTSGYVDPEDNRTNALTYKSDVFNFGVVLIELITSLRAYDRNRKDDGVNLFDTDSMVKQMINGVAELALSCLQSSGDMRPTMESVLQCLQSFKDVKEIQPQVAGSSSPNDEIVLLNNDLA